MEFSFLFSSICFWLRLLFTDDVIEKYMIQNSKLITKIDYTEDYRWGGKRTKDHWAKCNYKFDTPYRIMNFFRDVLVDPAWWQCTLWI